MATSVSDAPDIPAAQCILSVQSIPIGALSPDPKNARLHSKKQVRQIADSIKSFGFNVPILMDGQGKVIAGHGRLLAAKHLGWAEVPAICLAHLSDAQRQAFMIADNRLTEIASWDDGLLAAQLKELSDVELNFDLEVTGFDIAEIDLRIESLSDANKSPAERPISDVSGPPVCKPGDIWLLGRHRVVCGSALDEGAYLLLMGKDKAAAIFTDPPYNVKIDGHVSGLGKHRHREFQMAAGEMDTVEFAAFLTTFLKLAIAACKSGALFYVCMDWRHIPEMLSASESNAAKLFNLCIWTKPAPGMGSYYRSQHELVFVLKVGNAPHCNNVQLGKYGRNRSNVWPYAASPGFGRAGEEGTLAALHPTVKPVQLVADAILDSTRRGEIVLDPFLGSGTTLMAAERTGRRCHGFEIDPLYVDVIIRRWQAHTGAKARHGASGAYFDHDAGATSMPEEGTVS